MNDNEYEEFKSLLLNGSTMKYDSLERLFGEAKRRNDRRVVSILRNVVC